MISELGVGLDRFSSSGQFQLEINPRDGKKFHKELDRKGVGVTDSAAYTLDKFWIIRDSDSIPAKATEFWDTLTKKDSEKITLVKFHLGDIGLRDLYYDNGWEILKDRISREGLALCPQLTGPEIARLDPNFIPPRQELYILSEPMINTFGRKTIFGLTRHGVYQRHGLTLCDRDVSTIWSSHDYVAACVK